MQLFRENGASVVSVTADTLRTQLDVSLGASGAVIIHWSGGTAHHAAVQAGHGGVTTQWNGGPKTKNFTSFITSNP